MKASVLRHSLLACFVLALLLLGLPGTSLAQNPDDVVGIWKTIDDKENKPKSHVKIYRAKDGKYYGRVVHLYEPLDEDGKPKVDKNNPDEDLRDQPILNLLVMRGFEYDDGEWEDGKIYDPNSGDTYSCYMELVNEDKLKVRGFLGISLIGRTQYWYRVK